MLYSNTSCDEDCPITSDHKPLFTSIESNEDIKMTKRLFRKRHIVLKRNIDSEEINTIIAHTQFPRRPFVVVAHFLGLTQYKRRFESTERELSYNLKHHKAAFE